MAPRAALALLVALISTGLAAATLAPCPDTPNCVNSADPRVDRRVPPIAFTGDARDAWSALAGVVRSMPRARIVAESPGYMQAEFVSALFGFVDDVEFVLDQDASLIHLRSASRTGHYDFGVNRRRAEALREEFGRVRAAIRP